MFIGHFGAGLIGKKISPVTSLGTLFLASQFIDLLWPTFLLLGIEKVEIVPGITQLTPFDFSYYPFSHSLVAVVIWGLLLGCIHFIFKRDIKAFFLLALLVPSHWFLDLLVHRPDLPLSFSSDHYFGLGLWNFPIVAVTIEVTIFLLGIYFYTRITTPKNRIGTIGFWGLMIFLIFSYLGNFFSPPPPDTTTIAWVGQTQWLIIILAYWVDD
ncbi:MAG: hypothetical protein HOD92_15550, partial [Deltaproteobacteria bacterium]|nr:hypothetical protein [Deltaproteobacteria bacterium]